MKKIENKIIRVVLYIRVSTEEQVKHGYSIDSQKKRLLEFCEEQGYKVVKTYADEGKSARSKLKNRKELMKLVSDSSKGEFDRVVIWRLDRWFRSVADYYEIQKILESNNVDWECSDEEYDTYTSNGRLYLNVKLSIAQNESDQTGDRIRFNFNNMINSGRAIYGSRQLPLGYIVEGEGDKNNKNKRIIKDEKTKHIVNDMFENFELTGSIRKTLKYINNKYNLRICYDSMMHYFKNKLYYGCYRDNENYCEPYITKERFEKMRQLVNRNNKDNKKQHEYIFSGLVKCYKCGSSMSGYTHRTIRKRKDESKKIYKSPYYRCNKCWGSQLCTNKKVLSQSKLEKWILENFSVSLKEYIDKRENVKDKVDYSTSEKELIKLKEKMSRLNELYIDGRITKEKYDNDYKTFSQKIDEIENVKINDRDMSEYKKMLDDNLTIFNVYEKLTDENKRVFWSRYIDYIVQDDEQTYKIIFK